MAGIGSANQPEPIPYRQVESVEMRMEPLQMMQSDVHVGEGVAQFETNLQDVNIRDFREREINK